MANLLIIGRFPPPIGGVTMHLKRLTQGLRQAGFDFDFCDLGMASTFEILSDIARHRIIHIHFSNPAAQMLFAIFCRLTCKKLIITYHGCWGRYGKLGNWMVKLSARFAYVPIVQERTSLAPALRCNPRACEISTYIADSEMQPLPASLHLKIAFRCEHYEATFCTNAWNVTFDKYGREIYGISEMINRFAAYPQYQLLISDPSGNYRSYIQNSTQHISSNVFFVSHLHDFKSILLLSDAFIRNTTTDGISLSIHEARDLRIPVLASSTVWRPPFCSTFQDFSGTDLKVKLEEARRLITLPVAASDTLPKLIELYRNIDLKCVSTI
ncbi:Glycosyltransferase involved in cell wall bisynthesis [Dyadobacter soli]|uniref:Glycosyltransferase involved in cell wall bisynthesis n=1 Tax=Dyadobacter soli TaxID=659014 RepID=A0A1G7ZF52_9BACT|nr:glycosyltransferase [Dyadobacter soli]SDH07403.1 Glycosyltransferase involved in cell wall bisynthesis [Dyadobacter soli]